MSSSGIKYQDFTNLVQIGHGAFGTVYKATFIKTKKTFALKKMSKKKLMKNNMLAQVNKEIKISTTLKHENIIKVYDCIEDDDHFYLVLQLAEKGQLFDKLRKMGRFDQKTVKVMIRHVIAAVEYLHSRDPPIIHRDIKPENLLLDRNGMIKLADFGWSTFRDNNARKTYCGTVDYLAPEMIQKTGHDQRLDLWCVGVLVYELLTGRTPFIDQGDNPNQQAVYENICNVRIQFPEQFPTLAKSFVMGLVKRNPNQRMSLSQIKNHPWLNEKEERIKAPEMSSIKTIKKQEKPGDDEGNSELVRDLHQRIRMLEEENIGYKLKIQEMSQGTVVASGREEEISNLKNQNRRLKVAVEMNEKYKQENEKLWKEANNKDRKMIQLKTQVQQREDLENQINELKNERQKLADKTKRLQKDLKNAQEKNKKLESEVEEANSGIAQRVKGGQHLDPSEISSPDFIQFLQEQIADLGHKFEASKKVVSTLLEREKKENDTLQQLARYRSEQKKMRQIIKAELREMYENEKDDLLMKARTELSQEKQKWLNERKELKQIYENNPGMTEGSSINNHGDLEGEVRNLREVRDSQKKRIDKLELEIEDLKEVIKRNKLG